jgi:predicted RNA-binding protein
MCLSNVYSIRGSEKELLFSNAASVKQNGDTLVFTNILGVPFETKGTIRSVDLLENVILIDRKEEERK